MNINLQQMADRNQLIEPNSISDWFTFCDAVAQTAYGWFLQLVDKISATVHDRNVVTPLTVISGPVITHLPYDHPLLHGRMFAIEPSWRMRTTEVLRGRRFWQTVSSGSLESVPAFSQAAVALDVAFVGDRALGIVDDFVVTARPIFIGQDRTWKEIGGKLRNHVSRFDIRKFIIHPAI